MKQVKLSKLGDKAIFQFNKQSKVIWEVQQKYKGEGRWFATVTATKSGKTKNVQLDTLVWCKD